MGAGPTDDVPMINNDHIPDDPDTPSLKGWEILLRMAVFVAAFALICAVTLLGQDQTNVIASSSDPATQSLTETPPPTE